MAVRIDLRPRITRLEQNCPRGCVANRNRVRQNRLHPFVGRERVPLADADGSEEPDVVGVEEIGRLGLNHLVELLIEAEGVGADRVEAHAGDVHESCLRGLAALRRGIEWIHVGALLHALGSAGEVTPLHERPEEQEERVCPGPRHEVPLGGQVALVAGRDEQIVAALAAIRPGETDVGYPAEIAVVDRPEHARRHLQHHRSLAEVHARETVYGRRVRSEKERASVHQFLGETERLVLPDAYVFQSIAGGANRCRGDAGKESVDAAGEVEMVVDPLHRLRVGCAMVKAQRADARILRIRRGNPFRYVGRKFGWS